MSTDFVMVLSFIINPISLLMVDWLGFNNREKGSQNTKYFNPHHPHPKSYFIFSCLARQGSAFYRRLSLRCSDTIEIVALAPSQLSTITKQIQKTHTQRQVQKTNTNKKEWRSAERLLWHNLTKEMVATVVHLKSTKSRSKRNNTNKHRQLHNGSSG